MTRSELTRPSSVRRQLAGAAGIGVVVVLSITTFASGVSASAAPSTTRQPGTMTRTVSALMPILGPSRALAAMRPPAAAPSAAAMTPQGTSVNTWSTLFTMQGAVVHDVDFPTSKIGYAAAELGQVWKTTDGGKSWVKVLNRGFPYYYYGVEALSRNRLLVSGFNDQTSQGILTWSLDGGATWQTDKVISPDAWVGRVRLPGSTGHGLAMNGGGSSGTAPNAAWYTTAPDTWKQTVPDPNGGWFGNQFTLLARHAYASGITYCGSVDSGATWSCRPSIDEVFDGPTEFVDDQHGWVGGGEISPDVAGWLHRTTDGGTSWSGRVLETPYPIRQITFVSPKIGWAAGGNIYSGVGGISFTSDGGKTWSLDLTTGSEVGACSDHVTGSAGAKTRVWCIGSALSGSQFTSVVYRTTVPTP